MAEALNESIRAADDRSHLQDMSPWIGEGFSAAKEVERSELRRIVTQLQDLLTRSENHASSIWSSTDEARRELRRRETRSTHFGADLFSDPAWEILLLLFACSERTTKLKVSAIVARTGVPCTTTLRWLSALEGRDLVWRQTDEHDRRITNVGLTRKGSDLMWAYFAVS